METYLANYVKKLNEKTQRAKAVQVRPVQPLKERFIDWWESEPFHQKEYSLPTLAKQFNTTPRLLSPVLFSLGWTRHRRHCVNRPSCRFWRPQYNTPAFSDR